MHNHLVRLVAFSFVAGLSATHVPAQVGGTLPAFIRLQTNSPGTMQNGSANINGNLITGRVGVGGVTPIFPLAFPNVLGDKAVFWSHNQLLYGIGVQANLLQIYADTPSSSIAFGTGSSTTFAEAMRITGGGNVGIGTTNPGKTLDVNGEARFASSTLTYGTEAAARAGMFGLDAKIEVDGRTSFRGLFLGPTGDVNASLQFMGTLNDVGNFATGGFSRESNSVSRMFATVKNFVEVNPDDLSTDITYASIEGPEAAMYTRGTGRLANGRATIQLPSHFRALAQEGTLTVVLTPGSFSSKGLAYQDKGLGGITVGELGDGKGNYRFDWEVKAVRKRFRDYQVLRPWTERLTTDANRAVAWTDRVTSFQKDQQIQSRP